MKVLVLAAALASLICSVAVAQPAPAPTTSDTPPRTLRPLVMAGAIFKIDEGRVWLRRSSLIACDLITRDEHWSAGPYRDVNRLGPVFEEELRRAGLVSGDADNLFEKDRAPKSLLVGAIVRDIQIKLCGTDDGALARMAFHGSASMAVEWQVYDPLRKEILFRTSTTGTVLGGYEKLGLRDRAMVAAFRENARLLLAKPEVVALAHVAAEDPNRQVTAPGRSTLLLALAKDAKMPIPDAVGSVVTIFTGEAMGTGFLVSSDGYLITARHVVGDAKLVKVRWSDGFETEGEVVRQDKRRDVALVKTSAHGRPPLFLRLSRLNPGDTVYAIGTPLDPGYHGTVSRGIVSAYRLGDGMSFLQSDVAVNHGNSGGPLLDERGAVVGITDWGRGPNSGIDVPIGLNFFVPIGDALDFLGIRPAP